MSEVTQQDVAASENPALEPAPAIAEESNPVVTGEPEAAVETDEQKNAREVSEARDRSERKLRGVEKRIHELTSDKYAERKARERAEAELDAIRQYQRQPQQPQRDPNAGPTREQFTDYESYVEARAEWKAGTASRNQFEQFARSLVEQQQQQALQERARKVESKLTTDIAEYSKANPDYIKTVAALDDIPATPAMSQAILEADSPARIFHALAQNPKEAARIAALDPVSQVRAIGRLEEKLASSTPQLSKAPAPGTPVGSRSGPSSAPPEDMESFMRWRAKQRGE